MTIGEAARASGVSVKMIRYYERIGLIPPAGRSEANYRVYTASDVAVLRFIRQASLLGFPGRRIRLLVSLWRDPQRQSREVKRIALEQVAELDARVAALTAMRGALRQLADACQGDEMPDCPILDGLDRGLGGEVPEAPRQAGQDHVARSGMGAAQRRP
jgi:MerR family copper efflux transcriptional regulator